jgi:hypothetical protein
MPHVALAGRRACADVSVPKLQETLEDGGAFPGRNV